MTPADLATLRVLDLSLALMGGDEPKVFCDAARYDGWARQVASCTLPQGHVSDHVDVHSGHVWPVAS